MKYYNKDNKKTSYYVYDVPTLKSSVFLDKDDKEKIDKYTYLGNNNYTETSILIEAKEPYRSRILAAAVVCDMQELLTITDDNDKNELAGVITNTLNSIDFSQFEWFFSGLLYQKKDVKSDNLLLNMVL